MVKVNGVNGQPLHRVKYTLLLNEGSQVQLLRHYADPFLSKNRLTANALSESAPHATIACSNLRLSYALSTSTEGA